MPPTGEVVFVCVCVCVRALGGGQLGVGWSVGAQPVARAPAAASPEWGSGSWGRLPGALGLIPARERGCRGLLSLVAHGRDGALSVSWGRDFTGPAACVGSVLPVSLAGALHLTLTGDSSCLFHPSESPGLCCRFQESEGPGVSD